MQTNFMAIIRREDPLSTVVNFLQQFIHFQMSNVKMYFVCNRALSVLSSTTILISPGVGDKRGQVESRCSFPLLNYYSHQATAGLILWLFASHLLSLFTERHSTPPLISVIILRIGHALPVSSLWFSFRHQMDTQYYSYQKEITPYSICSDDITYIHGQIWLTKHNISILWRFSSVSQNTIIC